MGDKKTIYNLVVGDKIMVYSHSLCTHTGKYEIRETIREDPKNQRFYYLVNSDFKYGSGRYYISNDDIVLLGHDLPLGTDYSVGQILINNSSFNFVAETKKIAKEVLSQSLIPLTMYHKRDIVFYTPKSIISKVGQPLYKISKKYRYPSPPLKPVTRYSPISQKYHTLMLRITEDQEYRIWHDGEPVQSVVSYLSDAEREFIKTGITPEEWLAAFGPNPFSIKRGHEEG